MFSTVDHYQTFKPGRGNLKFKHLCKFKKKKNSNKRTIIRMASNRQIKNRQSK